MLKLGDIVRIVSSSKELYPPHLGKDGSLTKISECQNYVDVQFPGNSFSINYFLEGVALVETYVDPTAEWLT